MMGCRDLVAHFAGPVSAACPLLVSPALLLAQPILNDPNLAVTPYAGGFTQPVQIQFLGPDDAFVAEKPGGVKRYRAGVVTEVLNLNVWDEHELGLTGLTLDPDFANNGAVYVRYSPRRPGHDAPLENRLSRFTWNGSQLVDELVLGTFGTAEDGQTNSTVHVGGPMVFGPDGKLYGAIGDLQRMGAEQNNTDMPNVSSHGGGIYRLDPDGTAPNDNPFTGVANLDFHRWYAYGVRNSYGLAFDPVTGNLWDTENGPDSYDEINLVTPGFNSGWTKIMGPEDRSPNGAEDLVMLNGASYSDPEFSFVSPIGVTAIEFAYGSSLGEAYDDLVLVADINNGYIYQLRLNEMRTGFDFNNPALDDLVADTIPERETLILGDGFGGIPDLERGPDGTFYVLSYFEGSIYRIRLAGTNWTLDADGNWSDPDNWNDAVPNGVGAAARFGSTITAPRAITLDAPQTLGQLFFDSPVSYILEGAGPLTMDATTGVASISVLRGSHRISSPVILTDDLAISVAPETSVLTISGNLTATGRTISKIGAGRVEVPRIDAATLVIGQGAVRVLPDGTAEGTSRVNALIIAGGASPSGSFDLSDNALVIDHSGASPIEMVGAQIASAYNDGAWDGPGITSRDGDATQFALGYAEANDLTTVPEIFGSVDADAVLVRLTRYGDANLDGLVSLADFNRLATHFGLASGAVWSQGDFNYDGLVNLADFNLLAGNFGLAAGPDGATPEDWANLAAAVPEPAGAGLLVLTAAVAGPCRRRVRRGGHKAV